MRWYERLFVFACLIVPILWIMWQQHAVARSIARSAAADERLALAHEGVRAIETDRQSATTFSTEWSGNGLTHTASTPVHRESMREDLLLNQEVVATATAVWKKQ